MQENSNNRMKKMRCPKCEKRAFDISLLPKEKVEIELKCPNCHHFVKIPCDAKYVIRAS